ncbi:hypothetical protein C8R47DRAFT_1190192 [Mycena vitilis]|nr:hypothetical protein C8R47DRAFT_1190192 [Mycena vitilis]
MSGPIRMRDGGPYRVYGFVLNEEYLLEYALENGLGTDKDEWAKECAISQAADVILAMHKVSPALVAGVVVKGKIRTCAAIASEYNNDRMPMPPKATIEKLKLMIATEQEPRWYRHI